MKSKLNKVNFLVQMYKTHTMNFITSKLSFLFALILISGTFKIEIVNASSQVNTSLNNQEIKNNISTNLDCISESGLMWVSGPLEPEVAAQIVDELRIAGFEVNVEAQGYGEINNCDEYEHQGLDFTVKFIESEINNETISENTINEILLILTKYGKPNLGNVKIIDHSGELIQLDTAVAKTQTFQTESFPEDAVFKNVFVIVYDPLLSNGQKLSEYKNWNDHNTITQQTIDFFKEVSGNKLNYSVIETTIVTSGWPELTDGFIYTEETYLPVLLNPSLRHVPTGVNYNKIVNSPEFDICGKVNRGEIDEVWIYNGPWFGFYESTLVGPNAYFFNSNPVSGIHGCNKLLPIMGPSVERTIGEAVHNFTHRAEFTMQKVYGSWQQNNISHNWNKFALVKALSPNYSYGGCGNSHYPHNGTSNYDYSNVTSVLSNCSDFNNYPNLGNPVQVSESISCSTWGCTGLDYHRYWFNHFPHFPGCASDNVANDWWEYIQNAAFALYPSYACQENMRIISGNVGISNATLNYIDGSAKSVTADFYGNYFLIVSDNWSGTVIPVKDGGYSFTPVNIEYINLQTDVYIQNYSAVQDGPEINIRGNNISILNGDISPSTADHTSFGIVSVFTGTINRTFTIQNTGVSNLLLTESPIVYINGTHASDFTVSLQAQSPIAPAGSSTFTITFDPSAEGVRTASISIANNDSTENPFTFVIQGVGDIYPEMDVKGNGSSIPDGSTSPITTNLTNFGNVALSSGIKSSSFVIENTGAGNLSLNGIPEVVVSGAHAADFTVSLQPQNSIAPAGSSTFTVTFDPSAEGIRTASISIANNDSNENPYNFNIQGAGVGVPEIEIHGNSVTILDGDSTPALVDHTDFGNTSVTTDESVNRTFTIYNVGDSNLDLTGSPSKVLVSGTDASSFTVAVQPISPVSPSNQTTFTITFNPSTSGLKTATLSVYSNDSNENPYNFNIQGTGIGSEINIKSGGVPPHVNITDGDSTPSTTDLTNFGNVATTNGSLSATFTIENAGTETLSLNDSPPIVVSGAHASDFTVSLQPQSPIAPAGSSTFTITFDPSAEGVRTASISIANNDSNENPYNFSIQGTGVGVPEIEIHGNGTAILDGDSTPSTTDLTDFGDAPITNGTQNSTFTIDNIGTGTLSLSGSPSILISGAHASDFTVSLQPQSPIAPAGSSTFTITFDPSAEGVRTASISIANNDSNENPYNFNIQGAGVIGEDSYEPDNTSGQAKVITSGIAQVHSIIPANDVDWIQFTLATTSNVILETTGATASDTRMWLYDNNLNQIEYIDNEGTGNYSYIDRVCNVDGLLAGTYYVKVDEHQNDNEISSYNISLTTQNCSSTSTPTLLPAPRIPRTMFRLLINDTTPTLSWLPVNGALGYEITIASDKAFTNIIATENTSPPSFTSSTPLTDSVYYWRVRALNEISQAGKTSIIQTLTIDTIAPIIPTLTSPMDGAILRQSPILRWSNVSSSVLYEIQVDDNNSFTNPTTYTVRSNSRRLPALPDGIYYWRVRVKDAAGNWSDWSPHREFEIDR